MASWFWLALRVAQAGYELARIPHMLLPVSSLVLGSRNETGDRGLGWDYPGIKGCGSRRPQTAGWTTMDGVQEVMPHGTMDGYERKTRYVWIVL